MVRDCMLQWADMKQSNSKSLVKFIDKEGNYNFRGIQRVQLFEEDSKEISLVSLEAIPVKGPSLVGIVASSLLLSKLELEDRHS